jgi:hypothetical protein
MMTFGTAIKAYRLGFAYWPGFQAYPRISGSGPSYAVDLAPPGQLPSGAPGDTHAVWWEDPAKAHDLIQSSPVLRSLKRVKRPLRLCLDEDGWLVQPMETSRRHDRRRM